jgi:DNA polymerase III sliding clamp (beta) subunit (PCNA family)
MLNNYENQNINFDSLKDMLAMITQEKMCISKSENDLEIFWNPGYLLELINELKTSGGSRCY